MIQTQLNIFDALVIGIMLLSCLFAFFRGFVREILSLSAWIGAGLITIYYFPGSGHLARSRTFKSPVVAAGVATLGIYMGALIVFSMVNGILLKYIKSGSDVGLLDNALGLLFGAFRGALVVSLAFFLFSLTSKPDNYPEWIKQSVTHPYVEQGAIILARVAPQYLQEISSLQKKVEQQAGVMRPETDTSDTDLPDAEPAANSGKEGSYSKESAQQLERLIDTINAKPEEKQ